MKRKYPEKLIDNGIKEVRFFPANIQNKKREKRVSFVIIYRPIINSLRNTIQDNMYLLNVNKKLGKISTRTYDVISK